MARAEEHIRELLKLSPDERARAARVLLDSLDEGGPSAEKLREAWADWLARGPQGPLEDDEEDDEAGEWP
ncbi:MAG TPA: addiction module protein [Anaeromyxobacteraceae bacterium]|nr:addiction module protein [Anaeromyxobacteraceae bacterium]